MEDSLPEYVDSASLWEQGKVAPLVSLPSRNPPKVVQNGIEEHNWLTEVVASNESKVEQLLSSKCLALAKSQLDRLELECHVQPTYEEMMVDDPLIIRNQNYRQRKIISGTPSKGILSEHPEESKNSSSRISISALLSNEDAPVSSNNSTNGQVSQPAMKSGMFDSTSFIQRREIAGSVILPLKRMRIDPTDFIYQKPIGTTSSTITCDSYVNVGHNNYIYNDNYLYLSQDQELIARPNKRPCVYEIEYGSLPIRPEELSSKISSKWILLVKQEIYRQCRAQLTTRTTLVSLAKKTALTVQREVKKKVLKSVRQGKDAGNRGKKLSREVMMYWRKHDKEQRGAVRRAQKKASQMRKRDEEIREAKRQQKKLNFLLTQTELYAHFIGKKTGVGVDEDGPTVESGTAIARPSDLEDEELAKEAAKATEEAIQATRARMEAFDEETKARKKKLGIQVKTPIARSTSSMPSLEDTQLPAPSSMNEGNTSTTEEHKFSQPSIFAGKLKNYQIRGLNWLINLYDQGINGILADDMGLGKTIQTIAFLGHLAEEKDIWGPFVVIAPVSTLHNWLQEIARFTPQLKALPYWGTANDRRVIRKFWTPKHMYTRNASMHVVVTSYQLIVQDEKYFRRVKWQYMVLDEAHALKSSTSVRWKTLLSFHCRNRLLLTGTPIQNNMAELWALLHFIMPSFFDSHEEFNDWFSKDIENHAEGSGAINEQQLSRLHTILKPFMLRRVKNDIADEMVKKYEKEHRCYLTERQKRLYRGIKANISISDLLSQSSKPDNSAHLMNLVMQFRKVCNHPELFERRGVRSPFQFIEPSEPINSNPITLPYPKFLYRNNVSAEGYDVQGRHLSPSLLRLFSIYSPNYIEETLDLASSYNNRKANAMTDGDQFLALSVDSPFSVLRLSGISAEEGSSLFCGDFFSNYFQLRQQREKLQRKLCYRGFPDELDDAPFMIRPVFTQRRDPSSVLWTQGVQKREFPTIVRSIYAYSPPAAAAPIIPFCPDRSFAYHMHHTLYNGTVQQYLYGQKFGNSMNNPSDISWSVQEKLPDVGLLEPILDVITATNIFVPDFASVINDSGKLKELDRLLAELKAGGHCVLIYSQMTKMLDLLEEYMNYRKYTYHRLDGASKLSERRDMVSDFQNNGVFVFLLSTRAGGLGINLTAADTVIFYDSDWNPTMDDQAMDRAHRLGQTRPVTVYRLVTVNSIEERILARAKEKHNIQSIVIAGGKFEAGAFNSTEVVSLLLNDSEVEQTIMKTVQENAQKRGKKKKIRTKN